MLKGFYIALLTCMVFCCFQINVCAADGSADPFFLTGTGFNNDVRDIALQPDGKLIVVGDFTFIAGVPRKGIARLETNGNLDPTFDSGNGANASIRAVKLLPDGKILIGGAFTTYNGTVVNRFARLNNDGTPDRSFNTGAGANGNVFTIALQSDNKILVGGNFSFFNGTGSRGIMRLNPDGSTDQTYMTPIDLSMNDGIFSLTPQPDNKILIGGSFYIFGGTVKNLARLEENGALDASFQNSIQPNGTVNSIVVQDDQTILIGGEFTTVNQVPRVAVARLLSNGTVDSKFNPADINSVLKIVRQIDGKILLCGQIFRPQGLSWTITRLNFDGSTDNSFTKGELDRINSLLIAPDDKIIVGGRLNPGSAAIGGASPSGVRRLNSDGTRDYSYITRTGAAEFIVSQIRVQQDGKILFNGGGSTVGGLTRRGISRLNVDGTVDSSFSPGIYGNTIAIQPDGKIVIGGSPLPINGEYRFFRVNSDGSPDSTFSADSGSTNTGVANVRDMIVQPDGKIIAAGNFETINGVPCKNVVRLNTDGSIDTCFSLSIFVGVPDVRNVVLQPDGKILASAGGTVFRFNSNGTIDFSFQSGGGDNIVAGIALQNNGKIMVCGLFSQYGFVSMKYVARLNANGTVDTTFNPATITGVGTIVRTVLPQQNGKVIIGGEFSTVGGFTRSGVARLNADGSFDASFNAGLGGSGFPNLYSIVEQSNKKVLIGGDFKSVNGFERNYIARLNNASKIPFDFDGDFKTDISIFRPSLGEWWYYRSSDGGNYAAQFGNSTDKLVPGDFTGDGKTDVAIFRPSTGEWFILRSEDGSYYSFPFGTTGDIPAVGDFDGDGKSDSAVFRPSDTNWYIRRSSDSGFTIQQFGVKGDVPAAADYDGDGKSDIAIWRASVGEWWIKKSSDASVVAFQFGNSLDKPVQGDYTGDGKADIAIFRPSTGEWFVLRSENQSYYSFPFGTNGDIPAPGDYDGDGKFDATVFRPSGSTWYVQRSTAGTLIQSFGITGDMPVPNAFVP